MVFTIESNKVTVDTFSLTVIRDGARIYVSDPLDVPPELLGRSAAEGIWDSLRKLTHAAIGAESPRDDRIGLALLLQAAYWKMVADIGETPKDWVCLLYIPGFLGGLTCDTVHKEEPVLHPWSLEICGLPRFDGNGHPCRGNRHDLWFPRDFMP